MATYDDETMQPTLASLRPGEKEHVLIPQDECLAHTNDAPCCIWALLKEQPLRRKGNRYGVHVCGGLVRRLAT